MIPSSPKTKESRCPSRTDGASYQSGDKVDALLADLRDAILKGEVRMGQRIAPVRELARKHGLSYKAALTGVKRLSAMGMVEMRRGSGTYVCYTPTETETARIQATRSVALMISARAHLFENLAASLVEELQQSDFLPVNLSWDQSKGPQQFAHHFNRWADVPPRALVLQWASRDGTLEESIRSATEGRCRVITAFRPSARGWHCVNPDYEAAARVATEHALSLGHRRIGFITCPCPAARPPIARSHRCSFDHSPQIRGITGAMRSAGVSGGFSVAFDVRPAIGTYDFADPRMLATMKKWLSGSSRPTAIVGDDFRLVMVMRAAQALGLKAPGDIQLVGMANTPWSDAFAFPSVSLGEDIAARHIADLIRMDGPVAAEATRHLILPPKLVLK